MCQTVSPSIQSLPVALTYIGSHALATWSRSRQLQERLVGVEIGAGIRSGVSSEP